MYAAALGLSVNSFFLGRNWLPSSPIYKIFHSIHEPHAVTVQYPKLHAMPCHAFPGDHCDSQLSTL